LPDFPIASAMIVTCGALPPITSVAATLGCRPNAISERVCTSASSPMRPLPYGVAITFVPPTTRPMRRAVGPVRPVTDRMST
jgi:hypothetical protein